MPPKKDRCLLVTGGAGFIGSNFTGFALKEGYFVVVLDALTYAGHKANLREYEANPKFTFVQGNICDFALVSELLRKHSVIGVFNFAAESHVDRSISGPDPFIATNVVGVSRLLSAALDYWQKLKAQDRDDFRFVQISTDEVFGSLGAVGKFSEKSKYEPNSPYSASKAAADHLVRAWHHTYGLPTITTNCSNNYGARQFPEKLIPHMIECALAGKKLPVYGDGLNVRDWIHVSDHCRGVLLAFEKGHPGGVYCLGGNSERTNIELVNQICEILDAKRPRSDNKSYKEQITFVVDRLGHDRRYAIDDSLAQSELGFTRTYSFNEGLRDTIDWYLANGDWCNEVRQGRKG